MKRDILKKEIVKAIKRLKCSTKRPIVDKVIENISKVREFTKLDMIAMVDFGWALQNLKGKGLIVNSNTHGCPNCNGKHGDTFWRMA